VGVPAGGAGRAVGGGHPAAWIDSNIIRPPSDDPIKRDSAELSRWTAGGVIRDVGRWGIARSIYEPFAVKYAAAGAPPLAELPTQGQRYMRRAWGTYTFERLPVSQRKFSRWSEWAAAALYWNDGLRPLAAIERLVAAETGRAVKLQGYFDACVDAGLMVQDNSAAFKKH
jgi:hypothetical protein